METPNTQATEQPSKDEKAPLWRQLVGAGAGMMVALALYNAYTFASPYAAPYLQASIAYIYPPGTSVTSPPSGEVRFSDKSISSSSPEFAKVGARARDIAKRLGPADDGASSAEAVHAAAPEESSSEAFVLEEASSSSQEMSSEAMEEESSSSAEVIAEVHEGAPQLPSSGVGMWLATFVALGGAVMMVPRTRKRVMERA